MAFPKTASILSRLILPSVTPPSTLPEISGVQMFLKRFRPVLAAIIALVFYTITDILVWQRIFEANQMIEYADVYHTGWFITLAGYAVMGILLMWGNWKDCLYFVTALFVLAFSGLEDVLYYLLDGKTMPDSLPWLEANPMIVHVSQTGVILSAIFWMLTLAILYVWLYWQRGISETSAIRHN